MKWSYNAVQKKGKALRNMLLVDIGQQHFCHLRCVSWRNDKKPCNETDKLSLSFGSAYFILFYTPLNN